MWLFRTITVTLLSLELTVSLKWGATEILLFLLYGDINYHDDRERRIVLCKRFPTFSFKRVTYSFIASLARESLVSNSFFSTSS